MAVVRKYYLGDILWLKKQHPCGSHEWKVIRTGADMKLKCMGCEREVWIERRELHKRVKKVVLSHAPKEEESEEQE